MEQGDIIGLIVSYVYAFGLLILATIIQKWRGYPQEFTRKIVHVGAGMWIFGLLALFDHWYWGVVPILTFIVFNFISYKFTLVKAMDMSDDSPGTVYFVVSIALLLTAFWPRGEFWIAAAGIMAMTWGDAFAAILGRKFGRHPYFIRKHRRTFEGSAAMFAFSFVAIAITLSLFKTGLEWYEVLGFSLLISLVATFLEAVSLSGLDNLFVPIGTSMTLYALVTWPVSLPRLLLGLVISGAIGAFAYQRRSLTFSGALGAMITGTLIFGFGGWVLGLTLIAFFVYGTALSKYKERQKNEVAGDKFEKGSRRDIGQALANGAFAAILAVVYALNRDQVWLLAAFIGTMATVNADTWATELGVLSRRPPRMITSGKVVAPGTSGGITVRGTSAAGAGALIIGFSTWAFIGLRALFNNQVDWLAYWWLVPAAFLGGLIGTMADSFLGATVQAMFTNPETGKETEKRIARNGVKNVFKRGWPFMDNDAVNFLSSIFGAGVAVLLYFLLVH
jgi:uncharacterized protein (TIGR00297 family)